MTFKREETLQQENIFRGAAYECDFLLPSFSSFLYLPENGEKWDSSSLFHHWELVFNRCPATAESFWWFPI